MCVEVDNSAVKGDFYLDVDHLSSGNSILSQLDRQKKNSFNNHQTQEHIVTKTKYELGDFIPAFRGNVGSDPHIQIVDLYGGYLATPVASDGGFCNDFDSIEFGKDSVASCFRVVSNLSDECEGRFGVNSFVSNIFGA